MVVSSRATVVMDSGLDASHRPGMTAAVIPGRAIWRGTGIHNHETWLLRHAGAASSSHDGQSWLWIPGSMLRIAPERRQLSFRDAPLRRGTGIHNHGTWLWRQAGAALSSHDGRSWLDSGLALSRAPE
jgi:hypothetical protein